MATKKSETKTATKKPAAKKTAKKIDKVIYRDREYIVLERDVGHIFVVLERNEDKVNLTDGLIHFWAKAKDVEGN